MPSRTPEAVTPGCFQLVPSMSAEVAGRTSCLLELGMTLQAPAFAQVCDHPVTQGGWSKGQSGLLCSYMSAPSFSLLKPASGFGA